MRKLASWVVAALLLFIAQDVRADIIRFATRADFDVANPGLPTEDFEEATNITNTGMLNPLDSDTDNGIFSPGDILPGVTFLNPIGRGTPGTDLASIVTVADSITIAGNGPTQGDMRMLFAPGVTAVAADIFNFRGDSYEISVFGPGDALLDSFSIVSPIPVPGSVTGGFLGVSSDMGDMTRIDIVRGNGTNILVDNVSFGTPPIPEPASLLLCAACLGLVAARRRRNSPAGSRR